MSDAATKSDPALAYAALRIETASLLGFDLTSDLPLTQSLQTDLVSLLRLEVGDLQGRVLTGQEVDLARLAASLGMLQKLLPPAELKAEPPPKVHSSEARDKLKALIEATILASPNTLEREIDTLRAENERLREALARAGAVPLSPLALPPPIAADAQAAEPTPSPPPPRQPPPGWTSGIQPHEVERTFSGREPWRPYATGGVPHDLYWGGAWGRRSW